MGGNKHILMSSVPPVVIPASGNNIVISPQQVHACSLLSKEKRLLRRLQRGNPVLDCIKNVGKEFGDILADYQVGRTTGVLFLR